jgi:hypothetical protein
VAVLGFDNNGNTVVVVMGCLVPLVVRMKKLVVVRVWQ